MDKILIAYNLIRKGESLNKQLCNDIICSDEIKDFQLSSLLVMLYYKKCNDFEIELKKQIKKRIGNIYYEILEKNRIIKQNFEQEMIYLVKNQLPIGKGNFELLIKKYIEDNLDLNFFSFWLMVVVFEGLSEEDVGFFTEAMIQHDEIIDYRNYYKKNEYFFIRRYPTGGLSEKTALILPSLLAAASKDFKIKSNFLVAKSLGYTGGTIDKLSALDGFNPPYDKKIIKNILDEFGVVMSCTNKSIAYADKKLYSFRSITGTVESIPLIVSSIASKQLSIPCDYLLMDIRYGEFAFIKDKNKGQILGEALNKIFQENMQSSDFLLTKADKPTGDSIGNILEIIEALDIMKYKFNTSLFKKESLYEQFEIVLKFFENLMSHYEKKETNFWKDYAINLFKNRKVEESFYCLLKYHGVKFYEIEKLRKDSYEYIRERNMTKIVSSKAGFIKTIKYDDLGFFVNYYINSLDFGKNSLSNGGIILKTDINETVEKGQTLCEVYSKFLLTDNIKKDIQKCFIIEDINMKIKF